jgi:predicted metal-binding transcription factor (methanogenesis marker protein 9)
MEDKAEKPCWYTWQTMMEKTISKIEYIKDEERYIKVYDE